MQPAGPSFPAGPPHYPLEGCPRCALPVHRFAVDFRLAMGPGAVSALTAMALEGSGRGRIRQCARGHRYLEGLDWAALAVRCMRCRAVMEVTNAAVFCRSCGAVASLAPFAADYERVVRHVASGLGYGSLPTEAFRFYDWAQGRARFIATLATRTVPTVPSASASPPLVAPTAPAGYPPSLKEYYSTPTHLHGAGTYTLVGLIARGGFAKVHLARAPDGRLVAVKEAWGYQSEAEREQNGRINPYTMALEKLRVESNYLRGAASRKGVVSWLDFVESTAGAFLVLEYVEGPNLRDFVKSHRRSADAGLELDQALRIFDQVLEVARFIHVETNSVHRDLTPDNILMNGDDPVLIDFGTVAPETKRPGILSTGIQKGGYHAPEQSQGVVSRLCDIYTLGSCLYYLLAGKDPPEPLPDMPSDKITRHEMTRAQVPLVLQEIVMRARSFAPVERYTTADGMRSALRLFRNASEKLCTGCGAVLMTGQRRCRKCDTSYCTACGSPVTGPTCETCGRLVCFWCASAISATASFCSACGASTRVRACRSCAKKVPATAAYCRFCGVPPVPGAAA